MIEEEIVIFWNRTILNYIKVVKELMKFIKKIIRQTKILMKERASNQFFY